MFENFLLIIHCYPLVTLVSCFPLVSLSSDKVCMKDGWDNENDTIYKVQRQRIVNLVTHQALSSIVAWFGAFSERTDGRTNGRMYGWTPLSVKLMTTYPPGPSGSKSIWWQMAAIRWLIGPQGELRCDTQKWKQYIIDPLGHLKVTTFSDNHFHTRCPSVYQNQNQVS